MRKMIIFWVIGFPMGLGLDYLGATDLGIVAAVIILAISGVYGPRIAKAMRTQRPITA
jgi:hypothetical protein